jgi:AraC family transcriptional regulator, positive regulator of tynA and feaB
VNGPPSCALSGESVSELMSHRTGFLWSTPSEEGGLPRPQARFPGQTEYGQIGRVSFCRIIAPPHRVDHNATGAGELRWLKVLFQLDGRASLVQGSQHWELHPGDWTLYDPARRYSVVNQTPVEQWVCLLPLGAVLNPAPRSGIIAAGVFGNTPGLGRLASAFTRALAAEFPLAHGASRSELGEALISLVRMAYQAQQAVQPRHAPSDADALRERIISFVNFHLASPDLSIHSIATALGCSKRHVHRLFKAHGPTLNEYISNERLERCRAELADPQSRNRSITEIAFSWGFNSAAYFSKAFRGKFGQSPRECRDAATFSAPHAQL